VARLAEALNQPDERLEAAEAIRALIDKIVLIPGAKRGELTATLHGELGPILEWTAQKGMARKGPANKASAQKRNTPGAGLSGVSGSVVAGAGFVRIYKGLFSGSRSAENR
jgi:site-specific DNA recombinase